MIENGIFTKTKFVLKELEEKFQSNYSKTNEGWIMNLTDTLIVVFNMICFLNVVEMSNTYLIDSADNIDLLITTYSVFLGIVLFLLLSNRILLKFLFSEKKKSNSTNKWFTLARRIRSIISCSRLFISQIYSIIIFFSFTPSDSIYNEKSNAQRCLSIFRVRLYNIYALSANFVLYLNFQSNLWVTICVYIISIAPITVFCFQISNVRHLWLDYMIIFFSFSINFYLRKKFDYFVREKFEDLNINESLREKIATLKNEDFPPQAGNVEYGNFITDPLKDRISINLQDQQINFISKSLLDILNKTFLLKNANNNSLTLNSKINNFSLNSELRENGDKENVLECIVKRFLDNLILIQKDAELKEFLKNEVNLTHKDEKCISKYDSLTKILTSENNFFIKMQNYHNRQNEKQSELNKITDYTRDKSLNLLKNVEQEEDQVSCKIPKDKENNLGGYKIETSDLMGDEKAPTFGTGENNFIITECTNKHLTEKSTFKQKNTLNTFNTNNTTVLNIDNVACKLERKSGKRFSIENKKTGYFKISSIQNLNSKKEANLINYSNSDINNPLINHSKLFEKNDQIPEELMFDKIRNNKASHSIKQIEKQVNNFTNTNDNHNSSFQIHMHNKLGIFIFDPKEALVDLDNNTSKNLSNKEINNILKNSRDKPAEIAVEKIYFEISFFFKPKKPDKHQSELHLSRLESDEDSEIVFELTDVTRFFKSYEKIALKNGHSYIKMSKLIHEFKTPLNCIIGLSSDINQSISNRQVNYEEVNDSAEKIFNLSNYTIFLIRDLMLFFTNEIKKGKYSKNLSNQSNINLISIPNSSNFNKHSSNQIKSNSINLNNMNNNSYTDRNSKILSLNSRGVNEEVKNTKIGSQIEFAISAHELSDLLNFSFSILTVLIKCSKIKKENIKPILKVEKELENVLIVTNEIKFKQILLNLISNSVKFTNSGVIVLQANFKNEARDIIEISVIDSGIGINKSEQQKIFKDFSEIKIQENQSKKVDNNFGTGLGLSLSRSFANFLGLDLLFDANYADGGKFTLLVPQDRFILESKSDKLNIVHNKENNYLYGNVKDEYNYLIRKRERESISKNKSAIQLIEFNSRNFIVSTKEVFKKNFSFFKDDSHKALVNKNASHKVIYNLKKKFTETDNIITPPTHWLKEDADIKAASKNLKNQKAKMRTKKNKLTSYFSNKDIISINPRKEDKDNRFTSTVRSLKRNFGENNNNPLFSFREDHPVKKNSKETADNNNHHHDYLKSRKNINSESGLVNCIEQIEESNVNDSKSVATKSYRLNYNINYAEKKISGFINFNHLGNLEMKSDEIDIPLSTCKEERKNSNNGIKSIERKMESLLNVKGEEDLVHINKTNNRNLEQQKPNPGLSNRSSRLSSCSIKSKKGRSNFRKKENKNKLASNNQSFRSEEYSNFSYSDKSSKILEKVKTKKILIADDNEILLNMLQKMLNNLIKKFNLSLEVIACNDGLDILNFVIEDQFNGNLIQCIITDENMEFIKGSDAMKILQDLNQRNKIKSIPVIFLTNYDDIFNLGVTADANNYKILSKPINYISLEAVLFEYNIIKEN